MLSLAGRCALAKAEIVSRMSCVPSACHPRIADGRGMHKDIKMNKLGVSTLESCLVMYDLRTYHPTEGFAGRTERITKSTLWGCHFLPQNREAWAAESHSCAFLFHARAKR